MNNNNSAIPAGTAGTESSAKHRVSGLSGTSVFAAGVVPGGALLLAVLVYTLGGLFGLPGLLSVLVALMTFVATWGHVVAAANAHSNSERIVNLASALIWSGLLLTLSSSALAMFAAGITGTTAGDYASVLAAWERAGNSPYLLETGREIFPYLLPLGFMTGASAFLTRFSKHVNGESIKDAARKLLMPIAFIGSAIVSLLHIYSLSVHVGYDTISSFVAAVLADIGFIVAEIAMLLELENRRRSGKSNLIDIAVWVGVGLASWGVMFWANVSSAWALKPGATYGELLIGALPTIIALLLAVASIVTAVVKVNIRSTEDKEAADAATRRESDARWAAERESEKRRQHELELARIKADARRPAALPRVPAGVELNQGDDTRVEVGRTDTKSAAS